MRLRDFAGLFVVVLAALAMPACAAIAGIFKAGVGVGIFLAVLVVVVIFFVISKARA